MNRWADVTIDDVRAACAAGDLIAAGPLNNAYSTTLAGHRVFVRQRIVNDGEYGQTFAAERFVYDLLGPGVRVPRLLFLRHDDRPVFAVFEFVSSSPIDWSEPGPLVRLANMLTDVHEARGAALGNVGQAGTAVDVVQYLQELFSSELRRTPPDVVEALGRGHLAGWRDSVDTIFRNEPIVLCHGDIRGPNVLMDDDGKMWLVDWEAARFRVAAADFNQTHYGWLGPAEESTLIDAYIDRTGRDRDLLVDQIRSLRILWHIRTLNFYFLVHQSSIQDQYEHVDIARALLRP